MPHSFIRTIITVTTEELSEMFDVIIENIDNDTEYVITENGKEIARIVPAEE